ncbi:MAG TPA: GNAT family N-acetyltransferase [Anaerolineales bacterium]|jgi:ribosomal-protein-alanine N-acetyltransferase|nr:GNAT family N-acetyltransferase [Anaerolineales bacterium]
MEIVPASLLDLNALNKLEHAVFEKDAWPLLDLIAVLTLPDIVRLKAVENAQMIGFAAGDPRPADGLAWIATIGIAPAFRRRGFGRELLHACEQKLKAARIRLSVRASNDGAIRLYEHEGYRRIDVWQKYYNDGEAAIVMEKERGI